MYIYFILNILSFVSACTCLLFGSFSKAKIKETFLYVSPSLHFVLWENLIFYKIIRMLSNIHKCRENNSIMNLLYPVLSFNIYQCFAHPSFIFFYSQFLWKNFIVIQFNISIFKGHILKLLKFLN